MLERPPHFYYSHVVKSLSPQDMDWPGWRLDDNPFGNEFDFDARKRMVSGSIKLLPYLNEIKNYSNKQILEIGPFFNPLVTPETFPNNRILYWENDVYVCKFLQEYFKGEISVFQRDLSVFNESTVVDSWEEISNALNEISPHFDYVVISHVLNYVDYRSLFIQLKQFVPRGGRIYLNHVVDYGLPQYFNHKRPKSHRELISTLEKLGFAIDIDDAVEDDFEYHGVYKGRHITVARVK